MPLRAAAGEAGAALVLDTCSALCDDDGDSGSRREVAGETALTSRCTAAGELGPRRRGAGEDGALPRLAEAGDDARWRGWPVRGEER